MLDSLPPARRRLAVAVAALLGLVVLAVAAVVVSRTLTAPDAVPQSEPGPVVVVPGYGGGTTALRPLVLALGYQGREVAVLPPADDNTGDLDAQAERLTAFVDGVIEREDAASVDVVGYSAGGVVARLWVRDHGGAAKARRVLTVGSPHHGTSVAALATQAVGCPVACEQLTPDSDLLRRLNGGDETPDGPLWATVRSSSDQVVTPTDSAELDGADVNVLVQDLCPDERASHGDLPGDPVTLAMLTSVLGTSAPQAPRDVPCR
ncbi:esterase/lipase family protein [Solicola sp. PLA-1-18]|uniref:esterase/lipase family protein n=1 Tax=Solicola sp. PLA-1-18 TaxID=3380532 RepID=UPI003B766822